MLFRSSITLDVAGSHRINETTGSGGLEPLDISLQPRQALVSSNLPDFCDAGHKFAAECTYDGNPEPPTPPLPPPPDPYDGPISHLERFSYDSEEKIMEARRKDAEDSYRERVKLREKEAREKEDRRIAAEKRRGCQS